MAQDGLDASNEETNVSIQQSAAQLEERLDPGEALHAPVHTTEDSDYSSDDDEGIKFENEDENIVNEAKQLGLVKFLHKYLVELQYSPERLLGAFGLNIPNFPDDMDELKRFSIVKTIVRRRLQLREKLESYNTIDDAVNLIKNAKRIMVLTGAGVSVSCGVPDFRSANGLYAKLSEKFPDIIDPQEMFDIDVFRERPEAFYGFAKDIYPSNFIPSPSHYFIKLLENKDKLLRNYSQNIDTIETIAGIEKVLHCHGSFAKAACIMCGHTVPGESIREDIFAERVPMCPVCPKELTSLDTSVDDSDEDDFGLGVYAKKAVMKPTITFFGEKLTDDFEKYLIEDREVVDLLIVIGTSLKVAPVSEIIGSIPHCVPQILINRDPVAHFHFDICLLGNSDSIVSYLSSKLEWSLERALPAQEEPIRVSNSHAWLFDGANSSHAWVRSLENLLKESGTATPLSLKRTREEEERGNEAGKENESEENKRLCA